MKRILHLIAQRPEKTGSGTYLQALIDQGRREGYEQAVIAGIPAGEREDYFDETVRFFPVRFETAELPFPVAGMTDIMPYRSTMYRHMTDSMYGQWRRAFTAALQQAVAAFQPDCIIAHHVWLLSALAKELFPHIPMTAISHGTDLRQMTLASRFAPYMKEWAGRIEHIAALHAPQKQALIDTYGLDRNKITVVGAGFNPAVFHEGLEMAGGREGLSLVYAGKLNFAKGVPSLIRAYNQLSLQPCDIRLAFAGSGTGEQCRHIEEMASQSRLPIDLKGILPQQELAGLFRQSQVFVLPSFYEGLPLVLLEALACGMRIVTTDLPGVREFFAGPINDKGFVEYVALPPLRSIDEPLEAALPDFEKCLTAVIMRQLERIQDKGFTSLPDDVRHAVGTMTWAAVFRKIIALFT